MTLSCRGERPALIVFKKSKFDDVNIPLGYRHITDFVTCTCIKKSSFQVKTATENALIHPLVPPERVCLWNSLFMRHRCVFMFLFIYLYLLYTVSERKKKKTCCFGEIEGLACNVAMSNKVKGSKMPTVAIKIQGDDILRGVLKRFGFFFFLCIWSLSVQVRGVRV